MKKILLNTMVLLLISSFSMVNVSANNSSTRASYTKTCSLPINDNYSSNGIKFQSSASLNLTIRVNDATGVITSSDAYLSIGWASVTSPSVAYTGVIDSISVSKSLSSSGRTAYASVSYDIIGKTYWGIENVSYHVYGHNISCS